MKYQFVLPLEIRFWLQKLLALLSLVVMIKIAKWVGDGTFLIAFVPIAVYLIFTRHVYLGKMKAKRAERINRMLDQGCGILEIAEALGEPVENLIDF